VLARFCEAVDPASVCDQARNQASSFRSAARNYVPFGEKISLANFSFPITLRTRAEFVRLARRAKMAWKTPKIVEVPVGMEINMYACAARK
jgi:coenzyme PQQ precursor peptide PqqA